LSGSESQIAFAAGKGGKYRRSVSLATASLAGQARLFAFGKTTLALRLQARLFPLSCPATLAGPARVFASQNRSVAALTTPALC